jgi:hypothetical protein
MRTSLNEIKLIDGYIFNKNTVEDGLLFDAMLIINPGLNDDITWQRKTHAIVRQYGRKQLKAEIETVHRQLFTGPSHLTFRQKILGLFSKQ